MESKIQMDEINKERMMVIDELERIQNRVRQLTNDKRELKDDFKIARNNFHRKIFVR